MTWCNVLLVKRCIELAALFSSGNFERLRHVGSQSSSHNFTHCDDSLYPQYSTEHEYFCLDLSYRSFNLNIICCLETIIACKPKFQCWNLHLKTTMHFNNTVTCKKVKTKLYVSRTSVENQIVIWAHGIKDAKEHVIYICMYSNSIEALPGGVCLHILNHTRDWWMGVLKSWVMVGSVSGENSYTSLKHGMPLCCDVKWHYPKDMWCDFVKVWTMNCVGGGMYMS